MTKKILMGVGAAVVLLVVYMGWNVRRYNQEGETIHNEVKSVLNLLKEDNYAVLSQKTAPGISKQLNPDAFKALKSSFPILGNFQSVDIKTVVESGDNKKEVSGMLVASNGETTPFAVTLEKSGNMWQLYSLHKL